MEGLPLNNEYHEILKVINVVNGIAQFDRKELEAYPEFAKVLTRLRPCKNDSDGRKKLQNNRELLYVKFMSNFSGQHRNFHDKARQEKAKRDAGLPETWEQDEVIVAAINKAIEIQTIYTPTVRLLNAIEKGLMLSAESTESQIEQLYTAINKVKELTTTLSQSTKASDAQVIMNSMADTSTLLEARIAGFMKRAAELPKVLKQIKELQVQVLQEQSGNIALRGGHKKGNREDPK